jgi:hypothetical protein
MLPSKNKQCTEAYAAVNYIDVLGERIKHGWDEIRNSLKELSEGKLIIRNERQAIEGLYRATVAMGMQAVKNIFLTEQAERLNGWIMYVLDDKNRTEVMKYNQIYEKAAKNVDDPASAVSRTLLIHCWLGGDLKRFEELGLRRHTLIPFINELFLWCGRYWNIVREECKLVESDSPPLQ